MKKTLVLLAVISMGLATRAQTYDWVQSFGSTGQDKGMGIDVDGIGNSYVTGVFSGTITIGSYTLTAAGGTDVYVAKCASNGFVLWAFSEGGTGNEEPNGISCDASGNFAITGLYTGTPTFGSVTLTSSSGYFLSYYNAAGTFQWVREFGTPNGGYAWDIDMDAVGCPIVVGYFTGTETFGTTTLTAGGPKEAFALRYASNGNFDWAVSMGGPGEEVAYAVNTDANCNIFVTGRIDGPCSFGSYSTTSNGSHDAFLTRIDSSGNFQWVRHGGGGNTDSGQGVDVDVNGTVTMTGHIGSGSATFSSSTFSSNGMMDCFVARYTNSGTFLWANHYGGSQDDYGSDVSLSISGAIFIGGFYNGTATFGSATLTANGMRELLIMMIDTNGNVQFALSGGGVAPEYARSISAGGGYVYFAGMAEGAGTYATYSIGNAGVNDIIVGRIKYNEVGVEENSFNGPAIFYDPDTDVLSVAAELQTGTVSVIDMSGRQVLSQQLNGNARTELHLNNLAFGVYYAVVTDERRILAHKKFVRS